ncbi:DNA-protecting protein DprA [bacterium]|nr:MAG: DNA-protecting protein DprA [bacterium]
MSHLKYWLALQSLPDIGPIRARKLLSVFENPENIFQMSTHELKTAGEINESRARNITGFTQWDRIQEELERIERDYIELITFHDSEYPDSLKHLSDAPLILYVKGEIIDDDRYAVAVIGSRTHTDYGGRMAERISAQIASYGLTVVSGMARGIDTASHKGALKGKGRTIAVLGSGIDIPYPPENKRLMGEIQSSGAVISEFPLGKPPLRENFPRRNRIISALSMGVVVVEATVDSGSLITVRYALEQGKEIFSVPGNVTSRNSQGTNRLIKEGAKLIESAEEIIEELKPQILGILRERNISQEKILPEMTDDEKLLLDILNDEPKHIDTIVRNTQMSSSKALSILLSLELKGVVRQVEGKRFAVA